MAEKRAENQTSSLAEFEFDDDQSWASSFGGEPAKDNKGGKVDEVVREVQAEDEQFVDEVPDTPVATPTTTTKTAPAKKPPVKTTTTTKETVKGGTEDDPELQKEEDSNWFDTDGDDDEDDEKKLDPKKKDEKGKTRTSGTVEKGKKKEEVDAEDYEEEADEVVAGEEGLNNNSDEDDPDGKKFFTQLAKEMKEKNVFQNIEIKDDEEVDEDKFFELQNQEVESRVDETLEAMSEGMDDDGKRFIKFKAKGGKTHVFMNAIASPIDLDNFSEDNQNQVDDVIKHYLTSVEELDGDELADRIEYLKSGGKQKATAVKYHAKLKAKRDQLVQQAETQLEESRKKAQKDAEDFNHSLLEVLSETESVGVIPITKQDQKELGAYMTKPMVKVGKNKYMPQMQADLLAILRGGSKEDKQALIALAKSLKSKFDIKDLATQVTTKVTKKTKSTLQAAKQGVKIKSSGGSSTRALSDFF